MQYEDLNKEQNLIINVLEKMNVQMDSIVYRLNELGEKLGQDVYIKNLKEQSEGISDDIYDLYRYYEEKNNK